MTPGTSLMVLSAAGCSAVDGSDGRGEGHGSAVSS